MALLASLQRPTSRALLLVALSFAVWGGWAATVRYRPIFGGTNGLFSDQISHLNAARLFMWCGTCLWRAPTDRLVPRYTPEEWPQVPTDIRPAIRRESDVFKIPGWAPDKPLIIGWSFLPRAYPPGALLLSAPVALAYHYTPISFSQANRLLYLLYLLYAHVGFFLVLRVWRLEPLRPSALGLLGGLLLYGETIGWALNGFYDVALIAPLVFCGHFLWRRRGLAALVCYCAAAFLHYRAYFFAPLALYALYLVLKDWRQWPGGTRHWLAVGALLVLGGASLYTFWLVSPWLPSFPDTNVLRRGDHPARMHLLLMGGLALGVLLHARAWMDMALLAWMGVMLGRVYQTMPWHLISLLVWLVLPIWTPSPERRLLVRDVRVGCLWLVAVVVYDYDMLPLRWLERL